MTGRALGCVALASALVVGCPESERKPVAEEPLSAIRSACAELATTWCSASALCGSARFASEYGDVPSCVERRAVLCEQTELGVGSTTTAERLRACAAAAAADLSQPSDDNRCRVFLSREASRDLPTACRWSGQLPQEARCISSSQCAAGTACAPVSTLCGRCRSPRLEGEQCFEDGECERGLACAAGSCAAFRTGGAACGPDKPCNPDLVCREGTCAERRAEGQSCDPLLDDDCNEGLGCSPTRKVCEPLVVHGSGDRCGQLDPAKDKPDDGKVALCDRGFVCRTESDPRKGTCVPVIDDGHLCVLEVRQRFLFGGPCRAPAVCFQSWCQIPDAAACSVGPVP